ncbi:MAG: heavy metal translocating P-type ATPase [Verrucomicrobiota bacterium]
MMAGAAQLNPSHAAASAPVTKLRVKGMTCNNCARHVVDALQSVDGVASALVELDKGQAAVCWKSNVVPNEGQLFQAVRQAGFEPVAHHPAVSDLQVDGMTCSGCARNVSKALQAVPGVAQAEVDLAQGSVRVKWLGESPSDEGALLEAVKKAGYGAQLRGPVGAPERGRAWSPLQGWQFNVVVGSALTLPLLLLEWGLGAGTERWYHWLAFALVTPIQLLCAARFYRGAWNQLRVGNSNMDTLVSLGSTTAFGYSVWALFSGWHGHLFFMEAASIITLVSVGHWIESKVSAQAAKSLRALLNLTPPTARLLDPGGAEITVPVAQLKKGDLVVMKPGDRVPIDCEVTEGASVLDESMLTGESAPVSKSKAATVYGGTVNLHGWLLGRVSATGDATALAQIIAVVQRAQNSRAQIQKLGDRVSSVFVPIVVLIAVVTGLWWGLTPASAERVSQWFAPWLWTPHHPTGPWAAAIYHAAAVLIVACPCAMGLATPVAIMAGTNVAARYGILIRDGVALEKSGQLTAVLFDKTGTLTSGQMTLADAEDFLSPAEQSVGLHKLAASLARLSAHPLSHTIAGLSTVTLPVKEWQEVRGAGVQANIQSEVDSLATATLRLGSLVWLRETGVDLTLGDAFVGTWTSQGATIVGLAAGQRLLGLMALRDVLKPHAAKVVSELGRQGKRTYLVTGDNKITAAAIGQQAGIASDRVFAEVRPERKADIVQQLQERGERVAFVGDGINDAPALEQADLGIAVAKASDVAREAADMILLKSDVQGVPEALNLAQATLRTIKQNLFWAFFYNAAAIPLAALGFLSPILSAFAMAMSDLVVIGNALRLRRWKMRLD